MIPFIAGNKKFEVPSNWNELTLHQAIELTKIKDSEDIAMFLSVITGLPYDDAKRISLGDLVFLLGRVLEFLKDYWKIQFSWSNGMGATSFIPDRNGK